MAGFGPPPKHPNQRRRRNAPLAGNTIRHLSPAGRTGDPPPWPWAKPTAGERILWASLWQKPQAIAWEEIGCVDVVARYAKYFASGNAMLAGEVRQLEDRLGLTPLAMLRLRWQIGDVEEPVQEEIAEGVVDIRDRLRAVDA